METRISLIIHAISLIIQLMLSIHKLYRKMSYPIRNNRDLLKHSRIPSDTLFSGRKIIEKFRKYKTI